MTEIGFCDVSFRYHYDDFAIFDGLTFALSAPMSSVWCDVQSGKGTLCKLLTGELKPNKGKILFDEIPSESITPDERGILYLTKDGVFFEHKSVLDNVAYPLAVRKVDKKSRLATAAEMLDKMGIIGLANVKLCKLNVAERRLVALARGLTVPRKIVLFDDFFEYGKHDEPTFDTYDISAVSALWQDATKVVLTADKRLLTGESVVLDGGKCVFCGNAQDAADYAEKCTIVPLVE